MMSPVIFNGTTARWLPAGLQFAGYLQVDANGIMSVGGGGGGSSPLTTKGDLYTYAAADARLPVGTDGQILSANSAQATGLEWIDYNGGTPYQEAPTGVIDGANDTFTISFTPNIAAAFMLFVDGGIQYPGIEYNIVGTTITFLPGSIPVAGQTIWCAYTVISGGGGGVVTSVADTASIDLTLALGQLTADIKDTYLHNTQGTRAAPSNITAVGGIPFTSATLQNLIFVKGSGGPVTVIANPQIAAGTVIGQKLDIIFKDSTDTVTLQDGTGLDLNGTIVGDANSALSLIWDGTNWVELSRRG